MSKSVTSGAESTAGGAAAADSTASSGEHHRGPLSGVRIVELAAVGPVPFCAMLLADMGAELLRVAPPPRGPPLFPLPESADPIARGRTTITLDLKTTRDRERLIRVLPHADALIEGFRPGVLERLGVGPDACLAANPRLVIGRMTGWGQTGPLAHAPGHDPNYLALTGAMHAIGYPDRPPCPPLNLVADLGGGALYLAMGVLAALLHVRSGGPGQVVDAAMVDGAASLMSMIYSLLNHGLWRDERSANLLDGGCPYGTAYETADGKYVVVCALEPPFYRAFVRALGFDESSLPPRDERASWPRLRELFAAAIRTRTRDEWARLLEGTDACVTPVLSMSEAPNHPHNVARGVFAGEKPLPGAAPRFSATPTRHAPAEGPPVAALLEKWGMSAGDARAMADR